MDKSTASVTTQSLDIEAPSYRWVVMLTWTGVHVWGYVLLETIGLFLPSMREDLGLTSVQEGWLSASAMIGNLILALPAGWLMSRFSPKALSTITFYVAAGLAVLQGWSPVYVVLLVGRFMFGAVMMIREPAGTLLTRQWALKREIVIVNSLRSSLWGFVAVGFLAVPHLLSLLDDDWRATFYAFGASALVLAVVWQVVGRERRTAEYTSELNSQTGTPITSLFRYPELWLVGIGMVGISITWTALTTFWPSFVLDEFDVSLKSSGAVLAVVGVVSGAGGILVGLAVSRFGRKKTVLWLSGILACGSTILLLHVDSFWYIMAIGVLNGAAWTLFPVVITIPFELQGIKPREIAVTTGFLTMAMWVGGALGPVIVGYINESTGDMRLALTVTSFCSLIMTAASLPLPRRYDDRYSTPPSAEV